MLRGFRWQFIALVFVVGLFVVALLSRSSDSSETPQEPSPQPSQTISAVVPPPTPVVEMTQEVPSSTAPAAQPSMPAGQTSIQAATYREALIGEVQRLNPVLAGLNPVDADITSLIFEGLLGINAYGEPVPVLAAEMPIVSFDGLEYVLRLREDVLWQDGTPFTATDVLYTMSLLSAPEFPGPEAMGAFWRTVETEQLGPYLVRFRLAQPLGSFMEALRVGILPAHALEGTTAEAIATHPFNLDPIGTGPYQVEALRSEGPRITEVDLRVAPVYRQRPEGQMGFNVERVRFKLYPTFAAVQSALQGGGVDAFATIDHGQRPDLLALAGSWQLLTEVEPVMGMLIFNWTRDEVALFRDQRVRQALAIGLSRSAVVERHLPNMAVRLDGPLPPGTWAAIPLRFGEAYPWPEASPTVARDLLARAGLQPGGDGPLLAFSVLVPDEPALVGLVEDLAAQWSQYGIEVAVDAEASSTYRERLNSASFDMAMVELSRVGNPDPDVYAFWHQGQYPDGLNFGGANDALISELLERGRQAWAGVNRFAHYEAFQRAFIERAIAIPLYAPLFTYVIAPEIEGVQLGYIAAPSDRFLNIRDWRINR